MSQTSVHGGADAPSWRKASASETNGCVELAAATDGSVAVRNSREPKGSTLNFTRAEMAAFFEGVRSGEFDDFLV